MLAVMAMAMAAEMTAAPSLPAQDAEGSILGFVRDQRGAPIAEAVVTVRHAETGLQLQRPTTAAGRFAFLQLPLGGPYTVRVRRLGYQPQELPAGFLAMGDRRDLVVVLVAAPAALPPVAVTGDRTPGRDDRVGGSTRISGEQLQALPNVDRDFTDLAALAPLAGPQLSLGGARYTGTGIRLDGVQARNQLRGGEPQGGPFGVSLEAVRELEVNTHVYDVGQGRQGGGEIAAATRFGTNRWQGTAFTGYRSEQLGAPRDFQGRARSLRPFSTGQLGGALGGPLVRDRLHLFLAYERQEGSEPLLAGVLDTPAAEVAAGIARDSLQRLLGVLAAAYGTSTPATQVGRIARRSAAASTFGRADWAPDDRHRLTIRHAWSRWDAPLTGGVDQPLALRESRSGVASEEHQALATLRSAVGRTAQHELRLAAGMSRRTLVPESPGVPRGFVQVRSALPDGSTGNTTVQFGGNRLAPDDSREVQLQVANQLVVPTGRWLLTLGAEQSLTHLATRIAEAQAGLFVFPSIAALEARQPIRFTRTVPLGGEPPATRQGVLDLAAFAQGAWRRDSRLAVTVGMRWDASAFLARANRNPLVERALGVRTDRRAADWRMLQPRAQLVWTPGDPGRDVFRVGGGRFAAPLVGYLQHNQLLHTGLSLADVDLRGAAVPTPDFAAYRANAAAVPGVSAAATLPPPYVNVMGALRLPATWKGSASWQRRLTSWITVTGSVLAARTTGNYAYLDRNLRATPAFTMAAEGGRGVYVPAASVPPATGLASVRDAAVSPLLGRVLSLESAGRGTQQSAVVEVEATPARGVRVQGSYAWTRARDNSTFGCCLARTAPAFTPVASDPRDLGATWASSDLELRHRGVASVLAVIPGGVTLGGRYVGVSGRPFSLVVDGDVNGDEGTGNDLAFIFDPGDPGTDPAVAASMRRLLANPDNVAGRYLRASLGRMSARNAVRTRGSHRVDLRAARPFPMGHGRQVELALDLFNALNLLNPRWGSVDQLPPGISAQNPVVNRVPLLRITGFDPVARRYRYAVNEQAGVLPRGGDPWLMQVTARVRW
jgi:hypothetical protein